MVQCQGNKYRMGPRNETSNGSGRRGGGFTVFEGAVVHPPSNLSGGRTATVWTGIDPRHKPHPLSLLPSGPDEVRDRLLRGGRSNGRTNAGGRLSGGDSAPHQADFGWRAPLAPRLAQPTELYARISIFQETI